jgi:hypothetical protein
VVDRLPPHRKWIGWREDASVAPPVIERCYYCSFGVSAPLEQAREAFEEHACDRPRPETSSRRRRGFSLR